MLIPSVLSECIFVLSSFYKLERTAISLALSDLISSPGTEIEGLHVHLHALRLYRENNQLHFVDCTVAATALARNVPVATFDEGIEKICQVKR